MNYETFLFTRNRRRDFTAFIRPKEMTNKEVSLIASALNYVSDVSALKRDWPSFYCFPLGAYIYLLRHYDSGRKHAGREIGVIEGVAVRREWAAEFARIIGHFLVLHDQLLAAADHIPDIEEQNVEPSAEHEWPEPEPAGTPQKEVSADGLISEFAERMAADRLFIPYTPDGWTLLLKALSDPRLAALSFAFGTNADVISELARRGIDMDILSYFSTSSVDFKRREIPRRIEAPIPVTPTEPKPVTKEPARSPVRGNLLTSLLKRLLRRP
jgi:hypothetical protein